MITEKLVNLNINTSEFEKVFTPNVTKVSEILRKYGFDVRVVGGAVRDFLQGKSPRDIDFATDADPSELIYIFQLEGLQHDDRGIGHGTIKAVFGDDKIDVTSIAYKLELVDGKVRMITGQDWEQDAQHRDLTINSMSIDQEGTVYDYVGGLADLQAQIVRMNPITKTRLSDDPHLIMRWFKAVGQFKNPKFNKSDYQLIKESIPLLTNIRGEEKTDREMASILTSNNGQKVIRIMCNLGAEKYLGINCD